MAETRLIRCAVVYARSDVQRVCELEVPYGTTVRQVLDRTDLQRDFPEIDLARCPIGIFGNVVRGEQIVNAGDRIEIYRPLRRDPREARRELAARGLSIGTRRSRDAG